jgi:uncharacterized membrane protein AbrB (regulator of aidB expression)
MAEPHTTAAVSAAVGVAVAAWIGIPLPALMGALAGAALILSFLPPRKDADGNPVKRMRTAGMVGFCTLGGGYGAPWVMTQYTDLQGWMFITAFALAAVLQVAVPLALDQRAELAERLLSFIPRGKS